MDNHSDDLPDLNRLLDGAGAVDPSGEASPEGLQSVVRRARAIRLRRLATAAAVVVVLGAGGGIGAAVNASGHHPSTSSAARPSPVHSGAANGPIAAPPAPHVSINIEGGAQKPTPPPSPPQCDTPVAAPLFHRKTNDGTELTAYAPGPGGAGWVQATAGRVTVQLPSDTASAPTAAVYQVGPNAYLAVLVVRDNGPGQATWRAGTTDAMASVAGYAVLVLPLPSPPAPGPLGTYTAGASSPPPGQPVPVAAVHAGSGGAQHCYEISPSSDSRG